MAASRALQSAYDSMFRSWSGRLGDDESYVYYGHRNFVPEDGIFRKYLEIPIGEKHIEIPIIAKTLVEERLSQSLTGGNSVAPLKNMIVSLYCRYSLGVIKTADSMVKKFFANNYGSRLSRAENGNGEAYYGNHGIILDKDYNILMCQYITADFDEEASVWKYKEAVLKINPMVFDNQQEFMSKAIIQKIVPLSVNPRCMTFFGMRNSFSEIKGRVAIEDLGYLEAIPKRPSPNNTTNEVLNNVLVDNISAITSRIV